MKTIVRSALFIALFFPHILFSQMLFDSSWYGFATGSYPYGQSPSEVRAGDLDNDGDSDLVVAQQGVANGFVVLMNIGRGIYAPPVKYTSPKASLGIVIADFNNDGRKDVALTNSGVNLDGNSVSVFFNTGKGKFSPAINYTVGNYPIGIIAADLDNDGDQDLAVCNNLATNNTISILINKGNGIFNSAINIDGGDDPFKITAAKINNDNLVDLIIGNNTQNVTILFNSSTNNFSKQTLNVIYTYPVEDARATVKAADFDNDGDNDIIFSSAFTYHTNNEIAFFTNTGSGTFNAPQFLVLNTFSGAASDLDVADFNNDGKKDILTCYFSGRTGDGYQILFNLGNNNFSVPDILPAGQSTQFITAADVDNDNKVDVVTSDFYSLQVTVHKNHGNGRFPIPALFNSNNSSAGSLDAADIDGDGDLDVVSSASSIAAVGVTVTVQKNNGNGTFTNGVAYSIRGGGVQAKFRDLNGDGKPDLVFATAISSPPYDFHTAINNGDGTFGPRQTWSMNACGWNDIEAVDLDNDGDRDVVITEWLGCQNVANSARRIFISKNNGSGVFSAPLIKVVNPFPGSIAAGDFNEDGKVDLVTGQSPGIDLHLGTGTGDLLPPISFATQQAPYEIIANDFNKDGHRDIAACTEFFNEGMSVLLGNGNGTFQPAQNYDGAYSPDLRNESGITSGDVDGDGDIDIMVSNGASNDVSVYLNKGNGTFIFKGRVGIYWGVESLLYADFTGDGKNDIVATVGTPPSGIQSQLAIIRGNVPNPVSIADKNAKENNVVKANVRLGTGMAVLNNPFTNYIDVKFENVPVCKITLQLTDLTGQTLARQQFNSNHNPVIRFDIGSKVIRNGIYILSAETGGNKYTARVMRK